MTVRPSPTEIRAAPRGQRPRILIEPNAHHLLNMGDAGMLQIAFERLQSLWPHASIEVITDSPERLALYCPAAEAVTAAGRQQWFQDRYLSETLHRILPARWSARLLDAERIVRRRLPLVAEAAIRLTGAMRRENSAPLDRFLGAVRDADLLVVSGAGALNDDFAPLAVSILDLLDAARRRGVVTAFLGQGIGPLTHPAAVARARAVLPHVDLISLREGQAGRSLLAAWGVPDDRILVTGDDAVELAYRRRRDSHAGDGLGIGVRAARYSALGGDTLERVGAILTRAAERHRAPLLPIPISRVPGEADAQAISEMLGRPVARAGPGTPAEVCKQIRECRVVVSGSYHAAVFGLAQGVPIVALARSPYYAGKFAGLREQFDGLLPVIALDDPTWPEQLGAAVDAVWAKAGDLREPLLLAAHRQTEQSRAAYKRLHAIAGIRAAPGPSARGRRAWPRHLSRPFNLHEQDSPTWHERAEAAVELLAANAGALGLADGGEPLQIADLGCGNERLRGVLNRALEIPHTYQGYDLQPQTRTSLALDVERELPANGFDVVFCLGLVEYVRDLRWFLRRLASRFGVAVISYAIADSPVALSPRQRRSRGWRTHHTRQSVADEFIQCGFDWRHVALVNEGRTSIWLLRSSVAPYGEPSDRSDPAS